MRQTTPTTPELAFDRFYDHGELTAYLHAAAEAWPRLVRIDSIGRSYEGREIWLCTLTNRDSGPPLEKPALLVEANVHSVEWIASTAALHLVERLAGSYGSDDRATRALDTRCLYVLPRLNPDGAEACLRSGRFIRSSTRPYPSATRQPGLHPGDVDGDGRLLFMRVRDPNGPWKLHPEEPRLLVAREPDEAGGPYYRLLPEGLIEGYDGATIGIAPPLQPIDLGSNIAADLLHDDGPECGAYPCSEPEAAALLRAVEERPNIASYVSCHSFGGVVLHPPASDDEEIPAHDRTVFEVLGRKAGELTGYTPMPLRDLAIGPSRRYPLFDWLYRRAGILPWIVELWSPLARAGIDCPRPSAWLAGDHPLADELRLLRWSDDELGGAGFVDWYPFEHPQLGPVELGGWDKIDCWYNPPFPLLRREVEPHSEWVLTQMLALPRLELRAEATETTAGGVFAVRAVVENTGWLPTDGSRLARDRSLVDPIALELELPAGAGLLGGERRVEVGQLDGRVLQRSSATWWGYDPGTADRATAQWLVHAPAGGTAQIAARHPRAGTARSACALHGARGPTLG
jgi:hypothetical protein